MGICATKTAKIGDYEIYEYYWHGEYPVYVNNRLVEGNFSEVCKRIQSEVCKRIQKEVDGIADDLGLVT